MAWPRTWLSGALSVERAIASALRGGTVEKDRMTEAEWLECGDPGPMLRHLCSKRRRSRGLGRKLRLFACACCRRLWPLFADPRSREGVKVAESYADGEASRWAFHQASRAAWDAHQELFRAGRWWPRAAAVAAARDIEPALLELYQNESLYGRVLTCREQVHLLRDIFGNPFRPLAFDAHVLAWQGGTAVRLAQAIYAERRFEDLPILADALEDAGCTDESVLRHCRENGPHVRGCEVLDRLLDRS